MSSSICTGTIRNCGSKQQDDKLEAGFIFKFLLEYSCFTVLCQLLLFSKVNQSYVYIYPGFPGSSVGKESACKAGDTGDMGLIPRLGRFPGRGHGNPFQYSCLVNPRDRGAWWAAVYGVVQNQTQLNRLSSSSSHPLYSQSPFNTFFFPYKYITLCILLNKNT